MERIQAILCYLRRDQQVLMIFGKKEYAPHFQKWNGVGGKFEKKDRGNPKKCCRRETKEESGYIVGQLFYHGRIRFTGMFPGKEFLVQYYSCFDFSGELQGNPDEGDLSWINIVDLPSLPTLEGDKIFLPWVLTKRHFKAHFRYKGREFQHYTVKFLR